MNPTESNITQRKKEIRLELMNLNYSEILEQLVFKEDFLYRKKARQKGLNTSSLEFPIIQKRNNLLEQIRRAGLRSQIQSTLKSIDDLAARKNKEELTQSIHTGLLKVKLDNRKNTSLQNNKTIYFEDQNQYGDIIMRRKRLAHPTHSTMNFTQENYQLLNLLRIDLSELYAPLKDLEEIERSLQVHNYGLAMEYTDIYVRELLASIIISIKNDATTEVQTLLKGFNFHHGFIEAKSVDLQVYTLSNLDKYQS